MIYVVNRGGCPADAIRVVGHTTKDGRTTVGRFGSGFAYAVALAVREGIKVKVSSEDKDGVYEMTATHEINNGVDEVVWMLRRRSEWLGSLLRRGARKVPSGFATTLGIRDWSGAFPIVREVIANARDADPDGWMYWRTESLLREYLAQNPGPVTVVTIDDSESTIECGPCGEVLANFDDYFRWPGPDPVFRWGTFGAIYRKPAPGPVKLFVRGVRCPWPGDNAPESLYDYSMEIELNEARSIKNPISATTAMTYIWHYAPVELKSELLKGVKAWIASADRADGKRDLLELMVNEHVGSSETNWSQAWQEVFGNAPASAPADAQVDGAVRLPPDFVAYVGTCGVPTVGGRSRWTAPSAGTVWIELRLDEVDSVFNALKKAGVAPAFVEALEKIVSPPQ